MVRRRKMKRILSSLLMVVVLITVMVLVGCSPPAPPTPSTSPTPSPATTAPAKEIEWKLICAWGKTNYNVAEHCLAWMDMVNKEMAGKLKVTWVGGPEAVASTKQLEPLQTGVFDVVYTAPSYFTGVIPAAGATEVNNVSTAKLKEVGIQQLIDEMFQAKAKVKSLSLVKTGSPFYLYLNQKRETADLSGLKIRSFFIYDAMIKALNGTPVTIPPPEIYISMQTGTIDGYFNPMWDAALFGKLHEVTKYWVTTGVGETTNIFLINLDSWKALDKATQDQLVAITERALEKSRNKVIEDMKLVGAEILKKGMQPINLSSADTSRYVKLWYDNTIDTLAVKPDPQYGPRLKEMLDKTK